MSRHYYNISILLDNIFHNYYKVKLVKTESQGTVEKFNFRHVANSAGIVRAQ